MSESQKVHTCADHLVLGPIFLLSDVTETESFKCRPIGVHVTIELARRRHRRNMRSLWKTCPIGERELFESLARQRN
jgi:hypothetical protein